MPEGSYYTVFLCIVVYFPISKKVESCVPITLVSHSGVPGSLVWAVFTFLAQSDTNLQTPHVPQPSLWSSLTRSKGTARVRRVSGMETLNRISGFVDGFNSLWPSICTGEIKVAGMSQAKVLFQKRVDSHYMNRCLGVCCNADNPLDRCGKEGPKSENEAQNLLLSLGSSPHLWLVTDKN